MLVLVLVLVLARLRPSRRSTSLQSIETTRRRIVLPVRATVASNLRRATSPSRQAAHSSAEPIAMSRNRGRSIGDRFPLPSAMLLAMDWLAPSRCLIALSLQANSGPSSTSPTQATNSLGLPKRTNHGNSHGTLVLSERPRPSASPDPEQAKRILLSDHTCRVNSIAALYASSLSWSKRRMPLCRRLPTAVASKSSSTSTSTSTSRNGTRITLGDLAVRT